MPAVRLPMRTVREILRMKFDLGRSHRDIGLACRISPSTVGDLLHRFRASKLEWPLPLNLSDRGLEGRLYRLEPSSAEDRPLPDWQAISVELRKKHVTLALLWQEYWEQHPGEDAYGYSRFCDLYRHWKETEQPPILRQTHKLGERVFVDFAGDTIPLVCSVTGEAKPIHLFVAVLGGSNYTYIEATRGEDLTSWIGAHTRMVEYFGGCPEVVVPDNLKSGVTKADFYDPQLNPTYQAWADHYEVAILPARKRKPRDKAKVEQGVLLAERWVIAVLRNRTFYDFEELRTAVWELNDRLNEKKFRKIPGCRRTLFEQEEKATLRPLPAEPFALIFRKSARVYLDYHVEFEGQFFSVPYKYAKRKVELRYTARTVEIYYDCERIAIHERTPGRRFITNEDHMPPNHRFLTDWNPERFLAWAGKTGASTRAMVERLLAARRHPEQSYRACLGILQGLPRQYGAERVELACSRAVSLGATAYENVKNILERGLESVVEQESPALSAGLHENVRGADYYAEMAGLAL